MSDSGSDDRRLVAEPGVRPFRMAEHNCFACGSLNEHGMRLTLHVAPGRCWTDLVLDERFEGWSGIAHGGILATILDEVMAWSLVGADNWGVTARLSIDFRRPVPVRRPIRAEGEIARMNRRLIDTRGRIFDVDNGEELARATATYMAADAERRRELRDRYGFAYEDELPSEVAVEAVPTR